MRVLWKINAKKDAIISMLQIMKFQNFKTNNLLLIRLKLNHNAAKHTKNFIYLELHKFYELFYKTLLLFAFAVKNLKCD